MASFCTAGFLYSMASGSSAACTNGADPTLMNLSIVPGLGFAGGLIASTKIENSGNFNSTVNLITQLKTPVIKFKESFSISEITSRSLRGVIGCLSSANFYSFSKLLKHIKAI